METKEEPRKARARSQQAGWSACCGCTVVITAECSATTGNGDWTLLYGFDVSTQQVPSAANGSQSNPLVKGRQQLPRKIVEMFKCVWTETQTHTWYRVRTQSLPVSAAWAHSALSPHNLSVNDAPAPFPCQPSDFLR